jgi:hypothetical protein
VEDNMFKFEHKDVEIILDIDDEIIEIIDTGGTLIWVRIPSEYAKQIFKQILRRNYIVEKDKLCINWFFKINEFDDFHIEISFIDNTEIDMIRMFLNDNFIKA